MNHPLRLAALAGLALLAAGAPAALAQIKADTVEYFDRAKKKEDKAVGKITDETAAGVKLTTREGGKDVQKLIPADDIRYIEYGTMLNRVDYRKGFIKESNALTEKDAKKKVKLLSDSIADFTETEGKIRDRLEAKRYMLFKAAMAGVKLAELDPTTKADALKRLKAFTDDSRSGWEMKPALQTLARLYEDAGKEEEARGAYEALARLPGVPRELAAQSEVLVARLYMRAASLAGTAADRAEKLGKAEGVLESLKGKLDAVPTQKQFVEAYLLACKVGQGKLTGVDKALADAIKKADDDQLRGVLHNLMGEYLLQKGASKEAFLHFLRVDALYNESSDDQARALYHLGALFAKRGEPARSRRCYERLADPAFARTAYYKKAKDEKKLPEEKKAP